MIPRLPFLVATLLLPACSPDPSAPPATTTAPASAPDPQALNILNAKAQLATIRDALDVYYVDNGQYPTTTQGLAALTHQSPNTPHWHQSLNDIPTDPWNRPYLYTSPGTRHPDGFDLSSNGPDGKPHTPDDIIN